MSRCHVLRESVRSLSRDGQEFVLSYALGVLETTDNSQCCIQASLKARDGLGRDSESGCTVAISHLQPELGRRIFELIAEAEDPVFPVHVPDIVRDQLSAAHLVSVEPCVREDRPAEATSEGPAC